MQSTLIIGRLFCIAMFAIGLWFLAVTMVQVDGWLLSKRVASDLQSFRNNDQARNHLSVIQTQQAAEKAVSLNNKDADHAMNAGLVWFFSGHFSDNRRHQQAAFKKAINHYEKAVELRPAWPHHYRNLHDLYYLTLRPMEMRSQMLRAVEKHGKWDREIKYYLLERTLARPRSLPQDLKIVETQLVQYLSDKKDSTTQAKLVNLGHHHPDSFESAMHRVTLQTSELNSSSFQD